MTEPRVFLRHARMISRFGGRPLCVGGIEQWCARYGIDMQTFAVDGIPGERFIEIGDANGLRALEFARQERADGRIE